MFASGAHSWRDAVAAADMEGDDLMNLDGGDKLEKDSFFDDVESVDVQMGVKKV